MCVVSLVMQDLSVKISMPVISDLEKSLGYLLDFFLFLAACIKIEAIWLPFLYSSCVKLCFMMIGLVLIL